MFRGRVVAVRVRGELRIGRETGKVADVGEVREASIPIQLPMRVAWGTGLW